MHELLDDLAAEHDALDALVGPLPDGRWDAATPAAGWAVRHQIAHLALFDEIGAECVTGPGDPMAAVMEAARTAVDEDTFSSELIAPLVDLDTAALLVRWRAARTRVLDSLRAADPRQPVPWGAGPMSARSFATARLMECWAHGLDCHAALGSVPADTDRLRHVCHIGYRSLPYAFAHRGVDMPGSLDDLVLEVQGPSGDPWIYGDPNAANRISGPAGTWARVAVQRLPAVEAPDLIATGPLATAALRVARAFV